MQSFPIPAANPRDNGFRAARIPCHKESTRFPRKAAPSIASAGDQFPLQERPPSPGQSRRESLCKYKASNPFTKPKTTPLALIDHVRYSDGHQEKRWPDLSVAELL